jgi:hypothetical protein
MWRGRLVGARMVAAHYKKVTGPPASIVENCSDQRLLSATLAELRSFTARFFGCR